jgi:hypothetical protein
MSIAPSRATLIAQSLHLLTHDNQASGWLAIACAQAEVTANWRYRAIWLSVRRAGSKQGKLNKQ